MHHLVASKDGRRAASAGFEGRVKVWGVEGGQEEAESGTGGTWKAVGEISGRYGCFQFTLPFTRGTGRKGRSQGIVRGRYTCGLFLSANSPHAVSPYILFQRLAYSSRRLHQARRDLGRRSQRRRGLHSQHDLRRPHQRMGPDCRRDAADQGVRDEREFWHVC